MIEWRKESYRLSGCSSERHDLWGLSSSLKPVREGQASLGGGCYVGFGWIWHLNLSIAISRAGVVGSIRVNKTSPSWTNSKSKSLANTLSITCSNYTWGFETMPLCDNFCKVEFSHSHINCNCMEEIGSLLNSVIWLQLQILIMLATIGTTRPSISSL